MLKGGNRLRLRVRDEDGRIHLTLVEDAARLSRRLIFGTDSAGGLQADRIVSFGGPLGEPRLVLPYSHLIAPRDSAIIPDDNAARVWSTLANPIEAKAVSSGRVSRFRRAVGKATGARHPISLPTREASLFQINFGSAITMKVRPDVSSVRSLPLTMKC